MTRPDFADEKGPAFEQPLSFYSPLRFPVSSDRDSHAPALRLSPGRIAAIGVLLLALVFVRTDGRSGVATRRSLCWLVPGVGVRRPFPLRGQGRSKAQEGRTVLSAQVSDTCGGFATFPRIAVTANGRPEFWAKVGGAGISGRWTTSTTIKGSVKTPCAKRQDYVMHLTG